MCEGIEKGELAYQQFIVERFKGRSKSYFSTISNRKLKTLYTEKESNDKNFNWKRDYPSSR